MIGAINIIDEEIDGRIAAQADASVRVRILPGCLGQEGVHPRPPSGGPS